MRWAWSRPQTQPLLVCPSFGPTQTGTGRQRRAIGARRLAVGHRTVLILLQLIESQAFPQSLPVTGPHKEQTGEGWAEASAGPCSTLSRQKRRPHYTRSALRSQGTRPAVPTSSSLNLMSSDPPVRTLVPKAARPGADPRGQEGRHGAAGCPSARQPASGRTSSDARGQGCRVGLAPAPHRGL